MLFNFASNRNEVPLEFICPISHEIMKDPVLAEGEIKNEMIDSLKHKIFHFFSILISFVVLVRWILIWKRSTWWMVWKREINIANDKFGFITRCHRKFNFTWTNWQLFTWYGLWCIHIWTKRRNLIWNLLQTCVTLNLCDFFFFMWKNCTIVYLPVLFYFQQTWTTTNKKKQLINKLITARTMNNFMKSKKGELLIRKTLFKYDIMSWCC